MQSAKDSFFLALRARLQAVNPQRTVTLEGESVPALLVNENRAGLTAELPGAFRIVWGGVKPLTDSPLINSMLVACECCIEYCVRQANPGAAAPGRELGAMDSELFAIATPAQTPKVDFSGDTPRALGSAVFWQLPTLGPVEQRGGALHRKATLTVFFYPERETQ